MLYIFLVDTGNMVQLDMNLALETVGYLKGVVARQVAVLKEHRIYIKCRAKAPRPEGTPTRWFVPVLDQVSFLMVKKQNRFTTCFKTCGTNPWVFSERF